MSDQGIWFKLWCSALDDPALDSLPLEDFARWCKLGALTKRHGTRGALLLSAPCPTICALFHVDGFEALLLVLQRLPGVEVAVSGGTNTRGSRGVSGETNVTVTFHNWSKYQGDFSTQRVRKHREMKRYRREEILPSSSTPTRTEKDHKTEGLGGGAGGAKPARNGHQTDEEFLTTLRANPAYTGIDIDRELAKMDAWLLTPRARGRKKTRQFIVNWLNKADRPVAPTAPSRALINERWKNLTTGEEKL